MRLRKKRPKTIKSQSPEYKVFIGMHSRCNPETGPKRYGPRGIYVDARWNTFDKFLADVGQRPSRRHQLGRLDNDGPYSPENAKWMTREENQANRCNTHYVTAFGRTLCLAEWMRQKECKVENIGTLSQRLKAEWPPEKAIGTPSRKGRIYRVGRTAGDIKKWARRLNKTVATLRTRMMFARRRGEPVESALVADFRPHRKRAAEWTPRNAKVYVAHGLALSKRGWAMYLGVAKKSVGARIKKAERLGLSLEAVLVKGRVKRVDAGTRRAGGARPEILKLLKAGKNTKEIMATLGISKMRICQVRCEARQDGLFS